MNRRWRLIWLAAGVSGATGCVWTGDRPSPEIERTAFPPATLRTPPPIPAGAVPNLAGEQPLDVFIRRALVENRTVQAAFHNVQSLRHRIPQVTTLDDPFASNTIFAIPSVAPQYSMMGYNPYNLTLAQQFPWFGTLRLRGEAAEGDVQVALAELAAAQLDAVAAVKRAYCTLYAAWKTDEILRENRKILEDFREIARERQVRGGTRQDVLRAEVLISELDRELATNTQTIASARASLTRQAHLHPESDFRTTPELPLAAAPMEFERLQNLALAVRPELRGRLAAVARDQTGIELARKRFYPNVTLGVTYMDMERTNAVSPTASGMPNVGMFVGFNLPVYRNKYREGVCEAQERMLADAKLYEAQRDETAGEIQDFTAQVKSQQSVLALLRDSILPRAKESFDLSRSDYAQSNVDYATVQSALREVLLIEIQIAQIEAELGKALAGLERAVGGEINAHPPDASTTMPIPPAPAEESASPFQTRPTSP